MPSRSSSASAKPRVFVNWSRIAARLAANTASVPGVRDKGAVVRAFYVSNVEQYLFMDGKQGAFYDNAATLPVDAGSVFIRPYSIRRFAVTESLCPIGPFLVSAREGRVMSNNEALACPK